MHTWLVTGARGFLGSNAGYFLRHRARAVGVARHSGPVPTYPQVIGLDLRESSKIAGVVEATQPSVIFHGAAIAGHETAANDPHQAHLVNAVASQELAKAAAKSRALMVYISTDALFSGSQGDYSETDREEPFSVYGETKLEGERRIRNIVEDHLIIRTNFFGWSETGKKSILEFFVESLRKGRPVGGYIDFCVSSLYVQHLLQAVWDLTEMGATGTFNVASSDALSKYEYAMRVAQSFRLDPSLVQPVQSPSQGEKTSRRRNLSLNTDKISNALSRRMPSQVDGIDRARLDELSLASMIRVASTGRP